MIKLNKENRKQYFHTILKALNEEDIDQFRHTFLELHPTDQLDLFVTLTKDSRHRIYTYISPKEMADIFGGLTFKKQNYFLNELNESYAYDMFNNMFTDDIVTFLTKSTDSKTDRIIQNLDLKKAKEVNHLLSYDPETAGAVMTKESINIASTDTVSHVITMLRGYAPDAELIYYLYVINEDGKLVGVVSLRDLIIANPDEVVQNVMSTRVVSVPEYMDQEEVGKLIKKYDFLAVPVVSKDSTLLGIITVDDIMDILEMETTEDFGEISTAKDATDVDINSFVAAKKRSPWIILLMFFGMITAGVIGWFEETLETVVLLGAFIPMIMDSAGNVGTQSLTVSVRGLALGTIDKSSSFKIVRRELGTGFLIGFVCMIIITLLIALFYGEWMLGLIVGISILITLTLSAVTGAILPLIINKFKVDPAVASGPFITTINDIMGLLIYFSIATVLLDII